MRILIIGALGQLGTALMHELAEHTVRGVDLPEVDITSRDSISAEIASFQPDVVLNPAAYTNVDGCAKDPALAFKVNGFGAHNVALACAQFDVDLVHISTNEVFPGDKEGGYFEWDTIRPINPYGNSKAAGEFYVRHTHRKHYIVRFAWLFAPGGKNFVHSILRFAKERGALRVVTDEIGNPTYVTDLAAAIGQLIQTQQYGTYHLPNAGSCSRWEFANEILRVAGLDHVPNEKILSSEFQRASTPPPFGALNNSAAAALGITLRPWQDAVAAYLRQHVL